jgi:hypothetical protein
MAPLVAGSAFEIFMDNTEDRIRQRANELWKQSGAMVLVPPSVQEGEVIDE